MGELIINIPGSLRTKKNHRRPIIVGGKNCKRRIANIPSKAYVKWEKEAQALLLPLKQRELLTCPISVEAHIFYKGSRPDLSGALESVGDCLQGIIWANDGQIESWDGSRLHHDLKNPRTELIVRWE